MEVELRLVQLGTSALEMALSPVPGLSLLCTSKSPECGLWVLFPPGLTLLLSHRYPCRPTLLEYGLCGDVPGLDTYIRRGHSVGFPLWVFVVICS